MPVPGDGQYEWAGRWAGEQLPLIYNPASGYIRTSNEMNIPADYRYKERKLGFEWVNVSRHQRLEEIMSKNERVARLRTESRIQALDRRIGIPTSPGICNLKVTTEPPDAEVDIVNMDFSGSQDVLKLTRACFKNRFGLTLGTYE